MNGIFTFIKKNYKYIVIIILTLSMGYSIFTGINNRNITRRLSEAEGYLRDAREKILIANGTIELLKNDNIRLEDIVKRNEERDRKLDEIQRVLEFGNRRAEEIYRGLTAGIIKIQSGFSGIEKGIGKLEGSIIQVGSSMDGSLELIYEGLAILNGLQK